MFKQYSVVLILSVGLAACGGSSKNNSTPTLPINQFTALETAAKQELEDNRSSAVSIAIYKNGEIVYANAFGNKTRNGSQEVTKDTLFQLGSTTKMLTSLATLQLVDEGIITTNDALTSALPDLVYPDEQATDWQDISVHHLMSHQGGFPDRYLGSSDDSELSDFMLNHYSAENNLMVAPETFFNYSNPTFSYLGAIVEYYRQQGYQEVIEENVFNRLGMTRATMKTSDVIEDGDYALGVYIGENGNSVGYEDINDIAVNQVVLPAGNYTWSTPTEILKMAEFLLDGNPDVLSDELRGEMVKSQVSEEFAGLEKSYGYGIYVDEGFIHDGQWYPIKLWQHGGNTDAYSSAFYILPEQNIAVSILSNGRVDDYSKTMLEALRSVATLPAPVDIPWGSVDADSFDKHEGTYQAGVLTVEISNRDGILEINIPELNSQGVDYERELELLGKDTFIAFVDSEVVEITFFPNVAGGESVYLRNRGFVGVKLGY